MKPITIDVYTFDKLDDKAKDRARDWYLQDCLDYKWWDTTYYDAKNIGLKLTSFDTDRNRHAEGEFIKYAEDCAKRILAEHGKDCETFKTAIAYLADLEALKVKHADPDASNGLTYDGDEAIENCNSEFLKSLLEDYSIMLQEELERITSDEQIDESILDNEYTFTKSGKREG